MTAAYAAGRAVEVARSAGTIAASHLRTGGGATTAQLQRRVLANRRPSAQIYDDCTRSRHRTDCYPHLQFVPLSGRSSGVRPVVCEKAAQRVVPCAALGRDAYVRLRLLVHLWDCVFSFERPRMHSDEALPSDETVRVLSKANLVWAAGEGRDVLPSSDMSISRTERHSRHAIAPVLPSALSPDPMRWTRLPSRDDLEGRAA